MPSTPIALFAPRPFHESLPFVLSMLEQGQVSDGGSCNNLKLLLFLLSHTALPADHNAIVASLHTQMARVRPDRDLFELYDSAVAHVKAEKDRAVVKAMFEASAKELAEARAQQERQEREEFLADKAAFEARSGELDIRSRELDARSADLDVRSSALDKRENDVNRFSSDLEARIQNVATREESVQRQRQVLEERDSGLETRRVELSGALDSLNERLTTLAGLEASINARSEALKIRENALNRRIKNGSRGKGRVTSRNGQLHHGKHAMTKRFSRRRTVRV